MTSAIELLKKELGEADGNLETKQKEFDIKVGELRKSLDEKRNICEYSGKESSSLQKENLELKLRMEKNLVEIRNIDAKQKGLI